MLSLTYKSIMKESHILPLLITFLLFIFSLTTSFEPLSLTTKLSTIIILYSLTLIQQVQHIFKNHTEAGFLEYELGNQKALHFYVLERLLPIMVWYIVPFCTIAIFFVLDTFFLKIICACFFCLLCLLISTSIFSALLGLLKINSSISLILYLPIQAPTILWTLKNFEFGQYAVAVALSVLHVIFISVLFLLAEKKIEENLF